jgi:hypothetical protein
MPGCNWKFYEMKKPGELHAGERFRVTAQYVLHTRDGDVSCTRLRSCSRFTVFHFTDEMLHRMFKRIEAK